MYKISYCKAEHLLLHLNHLGIELQHFSSFHWTIAANIMEYHKQLQMLSIYFKNCFGGVVLRWWRDRMGRLLSPLKIHQKIIWTWSKFHKTTSEHWKKIPDTQKDCPLSSKGGQNIKDKKRDKRGRDGDPSWERMDGKEKFPNTGDTLTSGPVGSFGISEGNVTGRKNK